VLRVRIADDSEKRGFALVIFDEVEEPKSHAPETGDGATPLIRAKEVEAELELYRQRLQAVIEEYETSQEEMQASNEELQSTNEELRSTMEELETSKEELQSMNEELTTVNQENRHRVEELGQLSSDLQNLLAATDIATLFLDRKLCIVRFTPRIGELFNVRHSDRGRPLSDLTHRLSDVNLQSDAQSVLDHLIPIEREVESEAGRCYLARVLPYRVENRIEGIVVTFIDISERKQAERDLAEAKEYAESIVQTLHEPLLVLNPDLTVRSVNQTFYEHFAVKPAETIGVRIYDLGNGQWNIPALRTLLEDVLPDSNIFNDYEVSHVFEDIGQRVMLLNARRLDHVQLILLGIRDITDRKRAETALRESEERLRLALSAARMGTWEWQVATDSHRRDANLNQLLGLEPIETIYPLEDFFGHIHPDDRESVREQFAKSIRQGRHLEAEFRVVLPDGSIRWLRDRGDVFREQSNNISSMAGACIDVTDRRLAEESLRASEDRLQRMLNIPGVAVLTYAADGTLLRANDAFLEMTGYSREDVESGTMSWRDMTPKEFIELSELQMKQLPTSGRIGPYEKECIHKDGSRTWMLYAGAALGDGTIAEYCIDVTDRRVAEEALRESEEQLRSLIESVTDFAIFTTDLDRNVTTWSPGAAVIFGYAPDEIVGRTADFIFTKEDRAAGAPDDEARTALATGRAADERWHVRKDGSRFFASGVLTPLQDGGLRGYAKVARDLTARKHLEDSLRDASQKLKSRVDEQTTELLQSDRARVALLRRLSVAQEEERLRLSRELHDHIGQLITGLILNLRAAENELNAGNSPQNTAARLSGLKEIVEELGREVHEVALRLRPTALDDLGLVAAVKNYVEHWSAQSGIETEFYTNFEERLPGEIETALYRVVQESLNNALKHAKASKVSVLLERRKGYVVAIIEDNGAGFHYDADAAQARLGLHGMRERLLAIDGELEIESASGTGTTIFARVPLSQATE
jgi:PAS domain S-box-containing protein